MNAKAGKAKPAVKAKKRPAIVVQGALVEKSDRRQRKSHKPQGKKGGKKG